MRVTAVSERRRRGRCVLPGASARPVPLPYGVTHVHEQDEHGAAPRACFCAARVRCGRGASWPVRGCAGLLNGCGQGLRWSKPCAGRSPLPRGMNSCSTQQRKLAHADDESVAAVAAPGAALPATSKVRRARPRRGKTRRGPVLVGSCSVEDGSVVCAAIGAATRGRPLPGRDHPVGASLGGGRCRCGGAAGSRWLSGCNATDVASSGAVTRRGARRNPRPLHRLLLDHLGRWGGLWLGRILRWLASRFPDRIAQPSCRALGHGLLRHGRRLRTGGSLHRVWSTTAQVHCDL